MTLGTDSARLVRHGPSAQDEINLELREHLIGSFAPLLTEDGEQLTQLLADEVQHDLIDALREAWPICPRLGHQHPLVSEIADGRASWVCPLADSPVARIGEIRATEASTR
jgi:hypothetical protein